MVKAVRVWSLAVLVLVTVPFNPVLNQPAVVLPVFVAVSVICAVALDRASAQDIAKVEASEDV